MGQYHITVNVDKEEFIHPHEIDNGAKLVEQVGWEGSTSAALFMLLAVSNGKGGGDFKVQEMIGRWAGDRIIVLGDYTDTNDYADDCLYKLDYEKVQSMYKDISKEVLEMLRFEVNNV